MRKYRRTTLIALFCLSVLGGLGLAKTASYTPQIWLLALTPLVFLVKKRNTLSLYLLILLGLGLGFWRGTIIMQKLELLHSYNGQKVLLQGKVLGDSVYGKNSQIDFEIGSLRLLEPDSQPIIGKIRVSGFGVHMAYKGDTVTAYGRLYPGSGSYQGRISYAKLQATKTSQSWLNNSARRFNAGMQNALPEPQASFALGLLIGQRNTLPSTITNQLIMVGLVHIVAVSGYNLTVLVRAAQRIGLRSKYQRLVLALGLILVFVLITGFSASIVRAAVVSVLSLWAWYYGLKIKPAVLIAFAAALTAFFNPFYIWGDLGWYLSFLAFFGIMVIAPAISARIFSRPPKMLTAVVLETLSAEIMTLPLIMMSFSQLSLISLVANALVVPLVPFAMLLSAVAAGAGALIPQFAGWLAWPARLLLTYMLDVVHLLANIPSIFIHRSIGISYMLALYGVVLAVVVTLRHRVSRRPKTTEELTLLTP